MRDYYAEYIGRKSENISETKVSKVSKGKTEKEKEAFDTFDTEHTDINQKNVCLDDLLKNDEMKAQFEFEVKERTAIMIFDGGLSEIEASKLSRENVTQTWFNLFSD